MPTADVQRVVIVGGGLAAAKTAEALRAEGYAGSIVLFAAERHIPYDRPPLSKAFLRGEQGAEDGYVLPEAWYAEHDVDLRIGTAVTSFDAGAHEVLATDGSRTAYDKLVLATGASPRRSDLPGADLGGVLYLRTLEDSERLREAFQKDAKVVIVGGGWIGLEAASAAREAGADVTVLEMAEEPLMAVLGPVLGRSFADLHREHGVDLRTGVTIAAIEPAADSHKVAAVVLGDGTSIPADAVLVGIGAIPNTDLAVTAGLELDNGIVVDAQGRSSDPDIFAVGDVANADTPALGQRVRVEHWANALDRPPTVAKGVLGKPGDFDKLPFFYSDQYDLGLEYSGRGGREDDIVIRGDLDGREYIAFWLDGDRVTAGMNVNVWDVQDDIQALITSRDAVDREKLADDGVPLTEVRTSRTT
ncbi:MAG TPA: FAD-dependent oxidoreductase [Lapillicoccus sp.]|jgi:3-phenylpropionate/trans-cinnamate dioxygenase ferredoxin reductase subunit|uniref:NAD(P)/FAD-dependent oxidoreductase n=1 Tax=Lapillicoccus sp. TaxID=1909287 RepID=UPI002F944955